MTGPHHRPFDFEDRTACRDCGKTITNVVQLREQCELRAGCIGGPHVRGSDPTCTYCAPYALLRGETS